MLLAYITYVRRGDFIKIICAKLPSGCGSEEIPTVHCGMGSFGCLAAWLIAAS